MHHAWYFAVMVNIQLSFAPVTSESGIVSLAEGPLKSTWLRSIYVKKKIRIILPGLEQPELVIREVIQLNRGTRFTFYRWCL